MSSFFPPVAVGEAEARVDVGRGLGPGLAERDRPSPAISRSVPPALSLLILSTPSLASASIVEVAEPGRGRTMRSRILVVPSLTTRSETVRSRVPFALLNLPSGASSESFPASHRRTASWPPSGDPRGRGRGD